MRLSSSLLATVVLAGCASHPLVVARPTAASAPMTSQGSPAPAAAPATITTPAPTVTLVPSPAPERDSAHLGDVRPAGGPMMPAAAPAKPEVTREAIDVFGDSMFFTPPVLPDSAADGPTWDMDVRSYESRDRVAHYVSMFSGHSRDRIAESLEKGTRYEAMIRAKFKAGGLPEDMYYLALVESGFNPNAYSRAAAVGMWQFMTSTGRGMGMRIDWWVDERRDPVKSTIAAVRFIRGLRDQFGSLYLAAAAYNGGPGRVARGLAKYSDDLENTQQAEDAFFVLAEKDYLRNETREYVPQLIAAALVAKEPVRYGMALHPLPPFAYDSVKAPGGTPLAAVARASGTTVAAIRELNPHFLRGMLPPGGRYLVRVPVGTAVSFDSALARLPREDRVGTHTIASKKGDTVDRIAEKHGISSAALEGFNPRLRHLKPSGKLVPGQEVVVPTPAVAAAALHVPDPSIEKYGSSAKGKLRTHTVRRGETIRAIARKYDTTPERLMRLNGLRKPMIFAGQDLIVSGSPKAAKAKRGESRPSRRSAKPGRKGEEARSAKAGKATKAAAPGTHSGAGSNAGARKPTVTKVAKKSSAA